MKRKRSEKDRRTIKNVKKNEKEVKEVRKNPKKENKVTQALSFRGIQGEEKKTQNTERAKEGGIKNRVNSTNASPSGKESRDFQSCKDAWKVLMGRFQASQVPPHYPEIKPGSAKLSRKGKVTKNNHTLIRNKWGNIELSKLNKPCAKIKSKGSNYKDRISKINKGNLKDERENLKMRGAPDENKDSSRSKLAEGKGC